MSDKRELMLDIAVGVLAGLPATKVTGFGRPIGHLVFGLTLAGAAEGLYRVAAPSSASGRH